MVELRLVEKLLKINGRMFLYNTKPEIRFSVPAKKDLDLQWKIEKQVSNASVQNVK